jgi:YggT family protein
VAKPVIVKPVRDAWLFAAALNRFGPDPFDLPSLRPMDIVVFVLQVLAQTLSIYTLVLLVRVLLSWFPNLDWSNPILSSVSAITDPYLNAFRGLIPPVGGLDLSSLLAFVALQLAQGLLGFGVTSLAGSGIGT